MRPTRIIISWIDPLNGEWLSGGDFAYSIERSIAGFYRKTAISLKKTAKQWCGYRNPILKISKVK